MAERITNKPRSHHLPSNIYIHLLTKAHEIRIPIGILSDAILREYCRTEGMVCKHDYSPLRWAKHAHIQYCPSCGVWFKKYVYYVGTSRKEGLLACGPLESDKDQTVLDLERSERELKQRKEAEQVGTSGIPYWGDLEPERGVKGGNRG